MKFKYTGISKSDQGVKGELEAPTRIEAMMTLQRQDIIVSELREVKSLADFEFKFGGNVKTKDIVLISRQIATLFGAQVSALRVFALLAEETENKVLKDIMVDIVADLEGGTPMSRAMGKHPNAFTPFFVNMVASAEESGRLGETFEYLADYLERNYELTSKAKNALIYPGFVITTFVAVMILMLTYIIPKVGAILVDSGQELPAYTKLVLGASSFLVNYGFIILAVLIVGIGVLVYFFKQPGGKKMFVNTALHVPYVGELYRKLYLSRMSDNLYTMLNSGIPMVRALETTKSVIGNKIYEDIIEDAINEVRAGQPLSTSLSKNKDYIPAIVYQMIKVGEETGKIGDILKTLSTFYKREVNNAVDTLVGLIEPAMIVFLGLGVGTLLASVLIPIYNVSSGM